VERQLPQFLHRGIAGMLLGERFDFLEGLISLLRGQQASGFGESLLFFMLEAIESGRFQQLGNFLVAGKFFMPIREQRNAIVEALVRPAFARAPQEFGDALLFFAPVKMIFNCFCSARPWVLSASSSRTFRISCVASVSAPSAMRCRVDCRPSWINRLRSARRCASASNS